MSIQLKRHDSFRAEDLLRPGMPEKFVEIIDGELSLMVPAKWEHNKIAWNLQNLFHDFRKARPDLRVGHDNDGFLVGRDPDTLLSPDASLFRRRPNSAGPWLEFAPEIVVEVLSDSNRRGEMFHKRKRFFDAGTEQFWIVDPEDCSIEFCFTDGRALIANGDAIVEGEGLVEGMRINLADIFDLES